MEKPVRILYLEDNPTDAELVRARLAAEGIACEIVCVQTGTDYASAIDQGGWALIISDFTLPAYDGMSALALAHTKRPDTPFIFFSGTVGEEAAIDALKKGASDYVLKPRPARLVSAVKRALQEAQDKAEHKGAEEALRQTEARKAAFFQSALDCIITIDHNGLILEFNPAAEATFGYASEAVLGKPMAELIIPPSLREKHHRGMARYLATGEGPVLGKRIEITAMRADGTEFPVELSITRIGMGGVPTFTASIRDISERKKAEQDKLLLEQQLRQAQKMEAIGQLTGGIAHDFNNMLTVIIGYSELMLQKLKADDPLRSEVEQVKEAGVRASLLTRQLLAFSRKQVLQPRVLDLNAVLTNMDRMLQRLIDENIDLVTMPSPGLGRVHADPGQIEQIIMNLAVNARDAMPQGGKLTIETANVELDDAYAREHVSVKPGPYVMLAVSDTGCGMDAETQARIFEPFFTTKEPGKGTGLGLSTVYGIVKQSGGDIWVYSEPDRGTTFKIYLPWVEGAVETVEPGVAPARDVRGSETILLVEDDVGIRRLVRQVLAERGYWVLEAIHGTHAIQISEQHTVPIHLLVTDVVMPGMSGRELAEHLKPSRPNMKVLFMSGYTDKAIVHHGELDPGTAFLQKPFTPDALARKVREVLDSPPGRQGV